MKRGAFGLWRKALLRSAIWIRAILAIGKCGLCEIDFQGNREEVVICLLTSKRLNNWGRRITFFALSLEINLLDTGEHVLSMEGW